MLAHVPDRDGDDIQIRFVLQGLSTFGFDERDRGSADYTLYSQHAICISR